jgi:hypothetical protein
MILTAVRAPSAGTMEQEEYGETAAYEPICATYHPALPATDAAETLVHCSTAFMLIVRR